jgi:DNA topoisomerase-2
VNAADNYQNDRSQNLIKVEINPENNTIKVWNNGKGIPIQIHKVHNCYVPDMIFGKFTAMRLIFIRLTSYLL